MPTYDYVCGACDHRFELFQSITAKTKRKCPACGRVKLRRLFGAGAAIVFKGSGFYKTDYRSESYKKAAAADSGNGAAAGSTSGSASGSGSASASKTSQNAKAGKKPESSAAGKS
jgi:putative FmdB family regulatory protein